MGYVSPISRFGLLEYLWLATIVHRTLRMATLKRLSTRKGSLDLARNNSPRVLDAEESLYRHLCSLLLLLSKLVIELFLSKERRDSQSPRSRRRSASQTNAHGAGKKDGQTKKSLVVASGINKNLTYRNPKTLCVYVLTYFVRFFD